MCTCTNCNNFCNYCVSKVTSPLVIGVFFMFEDMQLPTSRDVLTKKKKRDKQAFPNAVIQVTQGMSLFATQWISRS